MGQSVILLGPTVVGPHTPTGAERAAEPLHGVGIAVLEGPHVHGGDVVLGRRPNLEFCDQRVPDAVLDVPIFRLPGRPRNLVRAEDRKIRIDGGAAALLGAPDGLRFL